MSEPPPLRLVDADGVVSDYDAALPKLQRELAQLHDQLEGAEREIRSWRARYADLHRDQEKTARKNSLWPQAERLFKVWREATGHSRSQFTYDRFQKVVPYLRNDGYDLCELAVLGIATDPYRKPRANGSMKRFDDFEMPWRDRGHFEEAVCRAPADALRAYRTRQAELGFAREPPEEEPHATA